MKNYTTSELKQFKAGSLIDTRRLEGYYCAIHSRHGKPNEKFVPSKLYMAEVIEVTTRAIHVKVVDPFKGKNGQRTTFVFGRLTIGYHNRKRRTADNSHLYKTN